TGSELARDHLEPLGYLCNTLRVGNVLPLAWHGNVVDTSKLMGAPHEFETAILPERPVKRDLAASQIRKQAAVVVPVPIVLVPLPGAADERFLGRQLGLEVIDSAAQQILHCVNHAGAASRHSVHAVACTIP